MGQVHCPDWASSVRPLHQEQVRHYVREANKKGAYITLEDIRCFLKECGAEETGVTSILCDYFPSPSGRGCPKGG